MLFNYTSRRTERLVSVETLEGRQFFSATAAINYPTPTPAPGPGGSTTPPPVTVKAKKAKGDRFHVTTLVSDGFHSATRVDSNLINAWGLVASPTGPWWVTANETGLSITLGGTGAAVAPTSLTVPPPAGQLTGAAPTGIAYRDPNPGFDITSNGQTGPSTYLYVTEEGTIAGANPDVDATTAVTVVDRSSAGAIYKGVAIATSSTGGGERLFAADFHNARIDVFDQAFAPVTLTGAFVDPKLPAGFAPFNIQNVSGKLFVAYAKQDESGEDEVAGKGKGVVDVFDADGTLVQRFAKKKSLNAPWGIAIAPASFGKFAGDILIGNFGDGKISAYTAKGKFKGLLRGEDRRPLVIDGLWGIAPGNGASAGSTDTLYFAAGPGDEIYGDFGSITRVVS